MEERSAIRAQALSSLGDPLPPIPTSPLYQGALLVVGVAMVLLPLVYVSLILATAYGVLLYGLRGTAVFEGMEGRSMLLALLVYVGPLVAGVILILFMVKPLFARPAMEEGWLELDRESEPFLFAFVERLCKTVGARPPKIIRIDNQVNASASFHRGWIGLLSGDLVLTLGLPLVAGMSLRQLTGVLSHELGHFAQSAGMRLTYVIRSVNGWFHRVVHERDAWDEWLRRSSEEWDFRVGIILYLARFCVWLTRLLLTVLMYVGHAISSFMLRQMEFDADRYEARVAGSPTFEKTARRLTELSIWMHGARADAQMAARDGRLPDDLSLLLLAQESEVDPSLIEALQQEQLERKTHWADTHPCDARRIASARAEEAPGVFQVEAPARLLFQDFAARARRLTLADYERELGAETVGALALIPTSVVIAGRELENAARKAADRFFQGQLQMLRPLTLQLPEAAGEREAVLARLETLREALLARSESYAAAFARYDEADTARLEAHRGEALVEAGFRLEPGQFGLTASTTEEATASISQARARMRTLSPELETYEQLGRERLEAALGLLLHDPALLARLEEGEARAAQARLLLPLCHTLVEATPLIEELQERFVASLILAEQIQAGGGDEKTYSVLRSRTITMRGKLKELRSALGDVLYPFVTGAGIAPGTSTVAELTFPRLPAADDIGEVLDLCAEVLTKLSPLNYRVVAHLAALAEAVEEALGLPPLDTPPPLPPPATD
ncbi:MAG: M48 family metalloprotease [Deltaproteobacteria bacterium]|nr:M48 family metalloprotease [Deltaproteobacteria bacterium]